MQKLNFLIREIKAGWFEFTLGDMEVSASYISDHDGPRQLLKLLTELLSGEREAGYAVFEEEPGAYILSIKQGEQAELTLWYTETNLFDWYPMSVWDPSVLSEVPRDLKLEQQLLSVGDLDLYSLACAVGDAFSAYLPASAREAYLKHWMPFPMKELTDLRHTLGDYSDHLLMLPT